MNNEEDRRMTVVRFNLMNTFEIESPGILPISRKTRNWFSRVNLFKFKSKISVYTSDEDRIFSKLHDETFFMENQYTSQSWLQNSWDRFCKNYPPYQPQRLILAVWYIITFFFLWINMFQVPVILCFGHIAFEEEFNSPEATIFNALTILVLIIDMIIKVNISYYKHGIIVTNRTKILKNYLAFQFWTDFISLVILIIYVSGNNYNLIYLKLLFYIKFYSIWKYDLQIQKIIQLNAESLAIYKVFRIILIFLIYAHWMACGYFVLDYHLYNTNEFYRDNGYNWLTNSFVINYNDMLAVFPGKWYIWYLFALYWSLQTATTVGYGDITPKNPDEVAYVIGNVIVMCIMFAYFINSVWQILSDYNSKSEKYKKNMAILNRFLLNKNIPNELQRKIRAYLQYYWKKDTIEEVEKQILSKLTPNLKDQLNITMKYIFFVKLSLFNLLNQIPEGSKQIFEYIKKELSYALVEEYFSQDQVIFEEGDINYNLYNLLDGKVKITLTNFSYKAFISLTQNFGQYQFITEERRKIKAIAVQYSHVYFLQKKKFMQILKNYPSHYENYKKLAYLITIEKKIQFINVHCFNCYEDHHFFECPQSNIKSRFSTFKSSRFYLKRNMNRQKFLRANKKFQTIHRKQQIASEKGDFQTIKNFNIFFPQFNLKQLLKKFQIW